MPFATANGTLPEYYREQFQRRQDDYSDETPPVDVRNLIDSGGSTGRLTRYKCQGNYVVGLCQQLRGAIEDGVISDRGVQRDINQFLESDLNFQVGDPNNQQRIRQINNVIGRVLKKLG